MSEQKTLRFSRPILLPAICLRMLFTTAFTFILATTAAFGAVGDFCRGAGGAEGTFYIDNTPPNAQQSLSRCLHLCRKLPSHGRQVDQRRMPQRRAQRQVLHQGRLYVEMGRVPGGRMQDCCWQVPWCKGLQVL